MQVRCKGSFFIHVVGLTDFCMAQAQLKIQQSSVQYTVYYVYLYIWE